MALPKKLDHCPITPECVQRRLFEQDGTIYRYDERRGLFVPHACTSRGTESVKPDMVFIAQWRNKRTGRTRWMGPTRMRKSVELPPSDNGKVSGRSRDQRLNEWEHLGTFVARFPQWELVED